LKKSFIHFPSNYIKKLFKIIFMKKIFKTARDIGFIVLKQSWKLIKKIFHFVWTFQEKHSLAFERIQLTLMYVLAICYLIFTLTRVVGSIPVLFYMIIPYCEKISQSKFLHFWARTETFFFLYLIVIEYGINRNTLKFSTNVKFHILLVYVVQMIYNLALSWWDVIYVHEMYGRTTYIDRIALKKFLTDISLFAYVIYIYSYICSLRGIYPKYPGILQRIPDSMAFWLRLGVDEKRRLRPIEEIERENY